MPDSIIVNCPNCRQQFSIDPATLGQQFQCVNCGQTFEATQAGPTEIEPQPAGSVAPTMVAPPAPAYHGEPPPGQVPFSKTAIASLICGLLCWVWPVGVAALVTGIVGLVKTKNYQRRGNGMAVAGLVLGGIGLVGDPVIYLFISILLPALTMARGAANNVRSEMNLRQIGAAIAMYQSQYQGAYPPDLETLITFEGISTQLFIYPGGTDTPAPTANSLESGGHLSYTYLGSSLGAKTGSGDPTTTVVLYESGDGHLFQHRRGINILFADGHVSFESMAQANAMIKATTATSGKTP